jgi:glyoxylase-like metal-dependent hydrolase (beta-lactamase superfamily II)
MAQQGQKLSENLFLSRVNDTVYIATHYFPWESNSMIFFSDGELVLIDTPYTNDATKEVCEWASKEFEIKKITAINTGFHVDNLGGNQYLTEQGIDIFGADAIAKLLRERSNETQKLMLTWLEAPSMKKYYDEHAKMEFKAPNQTFKLEEGLTIKRGRLHYEIYFRGESMRPIMLRFTFPSWIFYLEVA